MRPLFLLLTITTLCLPITQYGQNSYESQGNFMLSWDNYAFERTENNSSSRGYGNINSQLSLGVAFQQDLLRSEKQWISAALMAHLMQHEIRGEYREEKIAFQLYEVSRSRTDLRLVDIRVPISCGFNLGKKKAFAVEVGPFFAYRLLNLSKRETFSYNQQFPVPIIGNPPTPTGTGTLPTIFIGDRVEEKAPSLPGNRFQFGSQANLTYKLALNERHALLLGLRLARFLTNNELAPGHSLRWSGSFAVGLPM